MKTNIPSVTIVKTLILFLVLASIVRADDWSVGGRDYHNVVVGKIEADRVHITYDGGIGTILIADMPPELKAKFAFDPAKAKAEADARESARLAAVAELQAEAAKNPQVVEENAPAISQAAPQKPTVDTGAIQSEIASLQADVAFMQKVEREPHVGYTKGAYGQKIKDEEAQIAALQGQLK